VLFAEMKCEDIEVPPLVMDAACCEDIEMKCYGTKMVLVAS